MVLGVLSVDCDIHLHRLEQDCQTEPFLAKDRLSCNVYLPSFFLLQVFGLLTYLYSLRTHACSTIEIGAQRLHEAVKFDIFEFDTGVADKQISLNLIIFFTQFLSTVDTSLS